MTPLSIEDEIARVKEEVARCVANEWTVAAIRVKDLQAILALLPAARAGEDVVERDGLEKIRAAVGLPEIDYLRAGDTFRNTLVERADQYLGPAPLWHGWAIMDAFLAGAKFEREAALAALPVAGRTALAKAGNK